MEIVVILFFLYILLSVVYWTLKVGISPMFSSLKTSVFISKRCGDFEENIIVDLGSGFGTLALIMAKQNPTKKVIGYELSPFPYYFSLVLKYIFRQQNLEFKKEDFLEIEFEKNILYVCYLFPEGMNILEAKIKNSHIKPTLLSSTFALPYTNVTKLSKIDDFLKTPIYLYKF